MIALGIGAGLTAFNYLFGQSLDASKYVTSTMLFVYIVIIIGMVWSIRFKTISPHNHRKILRFFYLVVGLVVALAAVEMAQIILTGGSSIMESISKYLIYSNSYVLNFIKFGGKRTTALYFEPAFFALALISIWLSIKQFGIKTPKTDAMILAGIILSGSFSGVMTFILFYLLEWAFQYLNKEAIKKKVTVSIDFSGCIPGWCGNRVSLYFHPSGRFRYGRIVIVLSYCRSAGDGRLFFDPY